MERIIYLMNMIEEEGILSYEWYMKAWIQYVLKSSTWWQDRINFTWPHEEYEVVRNHYSYDEATMYWDLEEAIYEEVEKKEFVKMR